MDFLTNDPATLANLGIIGFMFLFFYFFILRPQKKADQKRDHFQNSLKKSHKVVTAGGIYGTIVTLGEERATLKVAENVDIEISRNAIVRFQDPNKQEQIDKEAEGKK